MIAQENTGLYALIVAKLSICFAMMNMNLIKKYMYALSADKKKQKARLQGVSMHERGATRKEISQLAGISVRRVSQIIKESKNKMGEMI